MERKPEHFIILCITCLEIEWVKIMEKLRKAVNLNMQSRMEQVQKVIKTFVDLPLCNKGHWNGESDCAAATTLLNL